MEELELAEAKEQRVWVGNEKDLGGIRQKQEAVGPGEYLLLR